MANSMNTVVYKRAQHLWKVFGLKSSNSNRYMKLSLSIDSIPIDCHPVRAIESYNYIIIIYRDAVHLLETIEQDTTMEWITKEWKQVLGHYTVNDNKLEELQKEWHSTNLQLVCAIDGGLKDDIGTSSYTFFRPHDTDPIIAGSAVEYQPHITTFSTRQELSQ